MNTKGFTLLEVIIALFVISLTLVTVMEMFTIDLSASEGIRAHIHALARAQNYLEAFTSNTTSIAPSFNEISVADTGNSKQVTVTISWDDARAKGSITVLREFFKSPGGVLY